MKILLLISALSLLAFSCAKKESPVVIKNEQIIPASYNHETAVKAIQASSTEALSIVVGQIFLNTRKNFEWKSFWNTLNWEGHVDNDHEGIELSRILDLGRHSCKSDQSQAFIGFFNKASLDYPAPQKAELSEKIFDHYIWCGNKAPESILHQVVDQQVQGYKKSSSVLEKYMRLNPAPNAQQLQSLSDHFIQEISIEKKIETYKLLKSSPFYSRLSSLVFAETDASLVLNSEALLNLETGDFIDIAAAFRWEVVNTSLTNTMRLFSIYQAHHKNTLLPFEKANLLRSEFELLKSTEAAGHRGLEVLVLLDRFSKELINSFKIIENYLPHNSLIHRFGAEMYGNKMVMESDTHSILEELLLLRGKLQAQGNGKESNVLLTKLCKTMSDFGVPTIKINSDIELKPLGCFKYRKNNSLKINKAIKMGTFSAIITQGSDLEVTNPLTTLSVVNLTQKKKDADIEKVETEQKYNTLALPLIVGLKPLKDTAKFKAGSTYYLSLYHLYRDGSELTPNLEEVKRPARGYAGGNLTLLVNQRVHPLLKYISEGGAGQKAAPAKDGGLGVDFDFEEYKVKKWIRSFVGNSNFYLPDSSKTKRNLELLSMAATNEENFINVYIDPEYLDVIDPEMKEIVLNGVEEIIKSEGLMDVDLVRRSIRKALLIANEAAFGDRLTDLMPELSSELKIQAGPMGLTYENGEQGVSGEILYR